MKKIYLVLFILMFSLHAYAAAPDRRISDIDGHVLNVNSDGSIPVTLIGDLVFTDVDITTTGTITTTGSAIAIHPAVTVTVASVGSRGKEGADYYCDGIDDDVQIQAAIDALPGGKGEVKLLEGQFVTTGTIVITTGGVTISSTGIDGTEIKLGDGVNGDLFHLDVDTNDEFFTLKNLYLNGNNANNTSGRALYSGAGAASIRDVHINNCFFAFWAGDTIHLDESWGFIMTDSIIEYGDGIGLLIDAGTDPKISNCKIIDNQGDAIQLSATTFGANISHNRLDGGGGAYGVNVGGGVNIIEGNVFGDSEESMEGGEAIYVTGDQNIIKNNQIIGVSELDYGIHFTSTASRNWAGGNKIDPTGMTAAIYDEGTLNIVIGEDHGGTLQLQFTAGGNVTLGEETVSVADDADSLAWYLYRKAATEGDSYIRQYIDQYGHGYYTFNSIDAGDNLSIENNSGGDVNINCDFFTNTRTGFNFNDENLTTTGTLTTGGTIKGLSFDSGDVGGFSGIMFSPSSTAIIMYIDGTPTHRFNNDGTITDLVS